MGKRLKKLTDEARRKKRAIIKEKISHKQKIKLGGLIDLPEKGVTNV